MSVEIGHMINIEGFKICVLRENVCACARWKYHFGVARRGKTFVLYQILRVTVHFGWLAPCQQRILG